MYDLNQGMGVLFVYSLSEDSLTSVAIGEGEKVEFEFQISKIKIGVSAWRGVSSMLILKPQLPARF